MPENINEQLNIADAKGGKNDEGGENSRPKFEISQANPELSKTTSELNDLYAKVAGDKQVDSETLNKIREQILGLQNKEKEKFHLISASYTHPDGKQEIINLTLETRLADFLSFYQETKVDLPSDFESTVRDIWEKNQSEIEQAIEQNGFDEMLIIPPTPDIGDLSEKMKMENGYFDYVKSGGSVKNLNGIPFTSQNADKPHLVLIHKTQNLKDRPELEKTLNIKGKDVEKDQALTLEDYLIFQKKYFKETGKHLDVDGWTWQSTGAGARLVHSCWSPDDRKLFVDACGPGYRRGDLGVRPARCFF